MQFTPHLSPIPGQGAELNTFCAERAPRCGMHPKNLEKLLSPYAFNRQSFNTYGGPMDAIQKNSPAFAAGLASVRADYKAAICNFICPLPRCREVARQLNSSLEEAAEVIFGACFPQKINFVVLKQLSEHPEAMSWFANNPDVPSEHFKLVYDAQLPQRIAAAEAEYTRIAAAAECVQAAAAAEAERRAAAAEAERVQAAAAEAERIRIAAFKAECDQAVAAARAERDQAVAALAAEHVRANSLQEQLNGALSMIDTMLRGVNALLGGTPWA